MSTQGIELEIEVMDDLDKKFTTLPNALLRGDQDTELGLDFRGYTLRERCLLAALYGMKTGYRCSRDRVDRLAPELGRDAVDTVLRGLKKRGNLVTTRRNDPEHRGRFIWHWQVSLRPIVAGQSMPGPAGDGEDAPVNGSSIPGSSMHGSSTRGSSGSCKEEELGTSRTTRGGSRSTNPPTPKPQRAPAQRPTRSRKPGGDSDQLKDQPPDPVDALAVELAGQAGWNQRVTAAVLAEQVAENRRTWPVIERVMRRVAADPLTQGPSRIRVVPAQWWMDAARPEPVPRPPWCGECDPASRQRESVTTPGAATRCPACHPKSVASAA